MATAILPWFAMTAAERAAPAADRTRQEIEQLYVKLERALTNTVYRWLWNREDTRDVVQEAFVRLWEMRARVDWARAEPLVYRIACNLASKRRRSRRIWRFTPFADEPAADAPADENDDEARVRRAIDQLPERHRRVLVLAIHAELSYEQIADTLGISIGTVASRRNAAVAKLRRALEVR